METDTYKMGTGNKDDPDNYLEYSKWDYFKWHYIILGTLLLTFFVYYWFEVDKFTAFYPSEEDEKKNDATPDDDDMEKKEEKEEAKE